MEIFPLHILETFQGICLLLCSFLLAGNAAYPRICNRTFEGRSHAEEVVVISVDPGKIRLDFVIEDEIALWSGFVVLALDQRRERMYLQEEAEGGSHLAKEANDLLLVYTSLHEKQHPYRKTYN